MLLRWTLGLLPLVVAGAAQSQQTVKSPNGRHTASAVQQEDHGKRWSDLRINETVVTAKLPGHVRLLRWSDNSRYIFYCTIPDFNEASFEDGCRLYLADIDHWSRDLKVTVLPVPGFVVASPDSKSVAVIEGAGRETWRNKSLVVISLETGQSQTWTQPGEVALWPAWSPNSRQIVFTSAPATKSVPAHPARHLTRITFAGGKVARMTTDRRWREEGAQWDAEGLSLFRVDAQGKVSFWKWTRRGLKEILKDLPAPQEVNGYTDWNEFRNRLPPVR